MIQLLREHPGVIIFSIIVYLVMALGGDSSIFLMPLAALIGFVITRKMLYPFIALMILLPLADSAFPFAGLAYNARPLLLAVIILLILTHPTIRPKTDWSLNYFIPYFIVIIYLSMQSIALTPVYKSFSYLLVIFATPVVVKHLINHEKDTFLRSLILIYTLVYVFSFINIETDQTLQEYDRFSGIFNNPNALGIFSFLFFMLTHLIFKFQPQLFSRPERNIVTGLILVGVIYSRSRSGMFAIAIYWASTFIYSRWRFQGLLSFAFILFSVSVFLSFEDLIRGVGLGDFFRLESLETGSGRKLAMQEAWTQIKENPVSGYGLGYTETFFSEKFMELARKGHVGGVHNSFLWVWLDMGLIGLLAFVYGWFRWFATSFKYTLLVLPVGLAVIFSANVEGWLMGSLNHVTIQLIIILSLLSSPAFLYETSD